MVSNTVGSSTCSSLPTGNSQARLSPAVEGTPEVVQDSFHSGYSEVDKDNALSTSIQDLLVKNAIERVNREDSLGFYS